MSIRSDLIEKSKEEIEQENRHRDRWLTIEAMLGSPILPRTAKELETRMSLIALTDDEKKEVLRRYNIIDVKTSKDPKPTYPTFIIVGCTIVMLILFIWGFCRG